MLVPLVETGWIDPADEVAVATVRRYMQPIREAGVDTLILGCTHFPLLAPIIGRELGESVTLIDSGRETAIACARVLGKHRSRAGGKPPGTAAFSFPTGRRAFRRWRRPSSAAACTKKWLWSCRKH